MINKIQTQVLLTGVFGDGYITVPQYKESGSSYQTSCIHKEYLEYKAKLLFPMSTTIGYCETNGYAGNPIHTLRTANSKEIRELKEKSLEELIDMLDEQGIAMWFYDDGSLHKTKLFYNLCTHSFSKEEHELYILPKLKKYGIQGVLAVEKKADGRVFYYTRVNKYGGAYIVNKILKKYKVDCFSYKMWPKKEEEKWENKNNRKQIYEKNSKTPEDLLAYKKIKRKEYNLRRKLKKQ